MNLIRNKCPHCGAELVFNKEENIYECEYCKYTMGQKKKRHTIHKITDRVPSSMPRLLIASSLMLALLNAQGIRTLTSEIKEAEQTQIAENNLIQTHNSEDKEAYSLEADKFITQYYRDFEKAILDLINQDKEDEANLIIESTVEKTLDFLFYNGNIEGFTKEQVSKKALENVVDTIGFYKNVIQELDPKYHELRNYLIKDNVDDLDYIGTIVEYRYNNQDKAYSLS